ncbi:MAG: alcohol dehydrogenase catalytic domain-containing protein [Dehalococcoidia bacterium]
MKAVTFQGAGNVEVRDVDEPALKDPTDVIVRVTASAICGTDLHVYHGRIPMPATGWVLGHEYVGEIVETGEGVSSFKPGDRVVGAPFSSCGECDDCLRGWPSQCLKQLHFGTFMLAGAQAEYVRVPFGGYTLVLVPGALSDEQAILAGDVLSTGYFAAERGDIKPGDSVVVVGSGPVGLAAQMSARLFDPRTVIAIDSVPERLELARRIGSEPVNLASDDAIAFVRERTGGRGAEVVLEAVGREDALRSCFLYVRPAGTISAVGVYSEPEFPFPMFKAYLQDLTFRIGGCPVRAYMPKVLGLIEEGKLDPTVILTHTLPLAEAARAYEMFAERRDGCVKVVLKP